jgi:hypothetical protein
MRPESVDLEGTAQQADRTRLATAADEDDHPDRMGLQVRPPGGRERPAGGSRLDPGGGALPVGADIAPGTLVEGGERRVVEASPDFGLPATVKFSTAAWNPLSWGGAKTGMTPSCKQVRTTRPRESCP